MALVQLLRDHWVLALAVLALTWPLLLLFSPVLVPSALALHFLLPERTSAHSQRRGAQKGQNEGPKITMEPIVPAQIENGSKSGSEQPVTGDSSRTGQGPEQPARETENKENGQAGPSEEITEAPGANDKNSPAEGEDGWPLASPEKHPSARFSIESVLPVSTSKSEIQSPEPKGKRRSDEGVHHFNEHSASTGSVEAAPMPPAPEPEEDKAPEADLQTPRKAKEQGEQEEEPHQITPAPSPPHAAPETAYPKTVEKSAAPVKRVESEEKPVEAKSSGGPAPKKETADSNAINERPSHPPAEDNNVSMSKGNGRSKKSKKGKK